MEHRRLLGEIELYSTRRVNLEQILCLGEAERGGGDKEMRGGEKGLVRRRRGKEKDGTHERKKESEMRGKKRRA